MKSDDFFEWCEKCAEIENLNPEFIPSKEEIADLYSYTKTIRNIVHNVTEQKTGRPMKVDKSIVKFIKHGKKGETYLTEESFIKYLIFVSETANVNKKDKDAMNRMAYLNSYLRENLELT